MGGCAGGRREEEKEWRIANKKLEPHIVMWGKNMQRVKIVTLKMRQKNHDGKT